MFQPRQKIAVAAILVMFGLALTNPSEAAIAGARALLETLHHALNQRDLALLRQVWAEHDPIQLNNPLGGVLRSYEAIAELYGQVFSGPVSVWVEFYDIVKYSADGMVVFAGCERGEFTRDSATLPLAIRTTRSPVGGAKASAGGRHIITAPLTTPRCCQLIGKPSVGLELAWDKPR